MKYIQIHYKYFDDNGAHTANIRTIEESQIKKCLSHYRNYQEFLKMHKMQHYAIVVVDIDAVSIMQAF